MWQWLIPAIILLKVVALGYGYRGMMRAFDVERRAIERGI